MKKKYKYSSKTSSKIDLVVSLLNKGTAIGIIVKKTRISHGTINKIANQLDLSITTGKRGRKLDVKKEMIALSLIKNGLFAGDISRKTGIAQSTIKEIAKRNNLPIIIRKRGGTLVANLKRDNQIVSLIKLGLTLKEIGRRFKITSQRIYQIALRNNIKVQKDRREERVKLAQDIKNNNTSYKKVVGTKHKKHSSRAILNTYKKLYGNGLIDLEREHRNSVIVDKFSVEKKAANDILNLKTTDLVNPHQIKTRNHIYRITSRSNAKRFPQIGSRRSGLVFEKKKVINMIVKLRNEGLSFEKITDKMNASGLKTIQGLEFKGPNVRMKYLRYQKENS
jgi:DNA-binding transcriptional ArsR family regulator